MIKKRNAPIWLIVWFSTQVVSLLAATFLFTLGLILVTFILFPLALGVTALLAGLTAVSLSNRLLNDGLLTPVTAVVRWCGGSAAFLSILLIITERGGFLPTPPIVISSIAAIILALVATVSAVYLRQPIPHDHSQKSRLVIWLIGAFLAIPIVIFVASLFGWAGA